MKVPFGFLWFVANVRHFFKKVFGGSFKIFFIKVGASRFFFFFMGKEKYIKNPTKRAKKVSQAYTGIYKGSNNKKEN